MMPHPGDVIVTSIRVKGDHRGEEKGKPHAYRKQSPVYTPTFRSLPLHFWQIRRRKCKMALLPLW